jgi:ribosomal-protein-alanine N-acetyltransferase
MCCDMDKLKFLKSPDTHIFFGQLCFRTIATTDISDTYVDWMNDYEVTRYTEQRFLKTTRSHIISYLEKIAQSSNDLMYGIYENSEHIGTIKLGNINSRHLTADLSYLIGSKKHWGKGIASLAISEMVKIGFNSLGLEKISAGVYKNNGASIRVLEKNSFYLDGVRKAQFIYEDERIDALWFAKDNNTIV